MKKLTLVLIMVAALITQSFREPFNASDKINDSGDETYYIYGWVTNQNDGGSNRTIYFSDIYTITCNEPGSKTKAQADFMNQLKDYAKKHLGVNNPVAFVGQIWNDFDKVEEHRDDKFSSYNSSYSDWTAKKIDKYSFSFSYNN